MPTPIDLEQLSGPARKVLGPDAPAPVKLLAARGVIPGAKPGELVTVLVLLAATPDRAVSDTAATTLRNLPPPVLTGALQSDLEPLAVERLCDLYATHRDVVTALLRMPRITEDALVLLAERADEAIGELVANNEERLLQYPNVIEKLYMNKRVRMSTADRLIELAVRNGIQLGFAAFKEAAAAIRNELIPEPTPEPTYDDVLFQQTDQLSEAIQAQTAEDEDTHELTDEGEEAVKAKFGSLHAQIANMTVTQKIRRAQLGNSAERMILVRDPNRLVSEAAAKSPMLRENEAAMISASRSVTEDVLRIIAMNRDLVRAYQVKLNLVSNPRTPLTFASRLIPHLRDNDLRSLAKSKNIPGAIGNAVRQQIERKSGGKKKG
jgi:hypothetical protein